MYNIFEKPDGAIIHPSFESDISKNKPEKPGKPENPNKPDKNIVVLVNGTEMTIDKKQKQFTYEEIVKLAFGSYDGSTNTIYTVVYSRGPNENIKGTLVKGQSVKIKDGMVFNVGKSNKS